MVATDCDFAFSLAPTDAVSFSIGELAQEFAVSPRALRFYEEEGLIAPARDGPTRTYSRRDRARLAWILRGKALGFSLDEIGELLNLYDLNDGQVTQRAVTAERCRARIESMRGELVELESRIAQLTGFVSKLEQT